MMFMNNSAIPIGKAWATIAAMVLILISVAIIGAINSGGGIRDVARHAMSILINKDLAFHVAALLVIAIVAIKTGSKAVPWIQFLYTEEGRTCSMDDSQLTTVNNVNVAVFIILSVTFIASFGSWFGAASAMTKSGGTARLSSSFFGKKTSRSGRR